MLLFFCFFSRLSRFLRSKPLETPRWCSYEMAAFFRHADKARGRHVTVMPVTSAVLLCVLAVQFWIMSIGEFLVLRDVEVGGSVGESFWRNVVIVGALTTGIAGALVPVTLYIGIQLMDDLQKLPQQLQGREVTKLGS